MRSLAVATSGLLIAFAAAGLRAEDAVPSPFAPGPGQVPTTAACAACHPPTMITTKRYNEDKWAEVVDQMISKGAKVSDADYDVIVTYLARTYGPDNPA